ncbi:MAG: hypothetical protein ABJE66_21620 [Deltaproteobacteria bacterium]
MKRWLPWLVLAACARPPSEPARPARVAGGAPVVGAPVAEPRVVAPAADLPYALSPLPIAPHTIAAIVDGSIAELAVPADGRYAVTLDTSGGVLLWPTLDGKREPVVVATRIGAQVATLRDGDAIVIAVVDKLGQLELVRVTADGTQVAHEDLAVPRPIVQLVATSQRLVALRDDQMVAAFDARGALAGELETARGERIAQLLARNEHVVAVSAARRGKHTARALDLGAASLAWAPPSKRFESDDDGLALSPDGKHLLGSISNHSHVVKIDLVRGTSEEIDDSVREIPNSQFAVGFRDARTAVFVEDGKAIQRRDARGLESIDEAYAHGVTFTTELAIGGLGAPYLVVIGDDRTKYLGYRVGTLADALPSSDGGWLATDGGSLFHLDASLRLDKRIKTPFPDHPGWDRSVTLLDERHAIVSEDSKRFVYALGADRGDLVAGKGYGGIEIVHSTGLALLPGAQPTLARWNAEKGTFDAALDVDLPAYTGFIRLLDPAAAGGMIAMSAADDEASDRPGKQKITFHEVYGPVSKPRVRDRYEYVDNGELFSGHSGPNLDGLLPAAAVRATSTDRTLIVELANNRITMFDHDGNVRWARTANGARGLAWNRDDDLIAFGDGIARIALETGEYTEQRCGWDFGLWDAAPQTATNARMCGLP